MSDTTVTTETTPEATTTDVTPETTEETKTDKQSEAEANKTEALKQERQARRDAEAKLAEYQKKELDAIEKDKLKKWKYEEVIAEKEAKLSEYEQKLAELSPYKEKFETTMQKQIDELSIKIPEWKREFVNKLIDWKTHDQKVEILSEFAKEYKEYSPNAQRSNASLDQWVKPTNSKDAIKWIASMFMS